MTLRALLGARIDALSEEARTVLRVASVIGVTFREPVVAEVLGDASRRDVYDGLADASLIVAVDATGRLAVLPPAHPRRRVLGPAGERPAAPPRARRRSPRVSPDGAVAIGAVARHRAAAGDAERAVPLLAGAAEEAARRRGARRKRRRSGRPPRISAEPVPRSDGYRQRARAALEAVPAGPSTSIAPTPSV